MDKWTKIEQVFERVKEIPTTAAPVNFTDKVMAQIIPPQQVVYLSRRPEPFWQSILRQWLPIPAIVALTVVVTLLVHKQIYDRPRANEVWLNFELSVNDANTVALVGDFNGWNPAAGQMVRNGKTWRIMLPFQKGQNYKYVFIVDGQKWVLDPHADLVIDKNSGRKASMLDLAKYL